MSAFDSTPDLFEHVVISDDFVTEIARIEDLAPNLFRVTVCARERAAHDGRMERIVKSKLLMTGEAMRAISMALAAGSSFDPAFASLPTATAN